MIYTETEIKSMRVKYEVLMLIINENPLFYLIDNDLIDIIMELGLFAFNEEEGKYFGQLCITEKGKMLIDDWRAINN